MPDLDFSRVTLGSFPPSLADHDFAGDDDGDPVYEHWSFHDLPHTSQRIVVSRPIVAEDGIVNLAEQPHFVRVTRAWCASDVGSGVEFIPNPPHGEVQHPRDGRLLSVREGLFHRLLVPGAAEEEPAVPEGGG